MTKTLFKSSVAALALLVAAASFAPPAEAGRRGAGVAAGVIGGLAAGAIIGGALSRDRYYYDDPYVEPYYADPYYDDTYYAPPPRRVYVVPEAVDYGPPPGSGDWYAYCASKYRSFDARTGTYVTYDGRVLPCR